MTDEELKALVVSLAVDQKEISARFKETDERFKETDERFKELRESQNKVSEQMEKTDRKLDKVAKMIGGLSANQGDVAEDFFYNSLIRDNHLGGLKFDDVTRNMEKHRGQMHEEYDLFLTNGDSIAIVEVKYKAHLKDIERLNRKFANFKALFPIYKDYKLYGAMASFHFNEDVKDELLEQGYFVLERCGDLVRTENSEHLKVA